MKKRKSAHPVFKPYPRGQLLLPTDLDELIPGQHLVRAVDSAIERMDLGPLLRRYKGGGTSSYHPKMMLKVLVYAYSQRTYSSRQIAKALRENVHFMWLSGQSRPDFRTINRYRAVWAKNTQRYKAQLQEKIRGLLDEIARVNDAENEEYGDRDLEEMGEQGPIDAEKLEKKIQELNERLREGLPDKKGAKAVRKLEREYLPRQRSYEEQEKKLAGRNS